MLVVWFTAAIWASTGIAGIGIVIHAWRRPETDDDRRYSAIDDELSRRRDRVA